MTNTTQATIDFLIYRNEQMSLEIRGLRAAFRILEKRQILTSEVIMEINQGLDDLEKRADYLDDRVSDISEGDGRGW